MLDGVGEALLDNAVCDIRGAWVQVVPVARVPVVNGQAAGKGSLDEILDRTETFGKVRSVGAAQEIDQPPDLGLGRVSGLGDVVESVGSRSRVGGGDEPLSGTGLDDGDADAMGDDVVKLPGDPGPLVTDGLLGEAGPFLLQLVVACLDLLDQAPARELTTRPATHGPRAIATKNGLKDGLTACKPAVSTTTPSSPAAHRDLVPSE